MSSNKKKNTLNQNFKFTNQVSPKNKTSKINEIKPIVKCPKLQNVQGNEISKVTK